MTRQQIVDAGRAYAAAVAPADIKARAVLVMRLVDFARAFNIPADPAVLSPIYLDALADLPHDLLNRSISDAITTWKWHNAMPTPAELREPVITELGRRKRDLGHLRLALQRMPKPRDRSNQMDDAAASAAFATMRANIAASAPVRMMDRRHDDHRESCDVQQSVKRGMGMLSGLSLDERIQRAKNGGEGA